tara:strand:- start:82 stop:639 length:558 start_codon:yes stop_codon:yes gene_type:complete
MAKIILQNVRCSYVFVQYPRKKEDGSEGKYGVQILLQKDDPQVKKLNSIVRETLISGFGEDAAKKLGKFKLPLRDGDDERDGEEYAGVYFMNANSGKKPGIVNRNNEPADVDDLEEYCYSGAYFHASVNVYSFKSKDGGKPGVALGLNNLMLRKKGDRLDGSTSATSDFSDFGADNAVDDLDDEF